MADTVVKLDVENRVKLAVLEMLRDISDLVALMYGDDTDEKKTYIKERGLFGASSKFPCLVIKAEGFTEMTRRIGWYRGNVLLTPCTYKPDDPSKSNLDAILGWVRGWGQLTDLPAQLTATAAAQAAATELTCNDAVLDGTPFDDTEGDKHYEISLGVSLQVRPSR